MSEIVMRFRVQDGGKTYEGDFKVQNDDGTSTLPMMAHSLIKHLSEDQPEIHQSRRLVIECALRSATPPNEQR